MYDSNSIFSDAIYALSDREHIEKVSVRVDSNIPDILYLLCELDCPGNRQQACHIYPASDGERLIVAGVLALDTLDDDNYEIAENIEEKYDLQITEDQIGKNKVFSETVPPEPYNWDLYTRVLKVAKAEKEFSETRRT